MGGEDRSSSPLLDDLFSGPQIPSVFPPPTLNEAAAVASLNRCSSPAPRVGLPWPPQAAAPATSIQAGPAAPHLMAMDDQPTAAQAARTKAQPPSALWYLLRGNEHQQRRRTSRSGRGSSPAPGVELPPWPCQVISTRITSPGSTALMSKSGVFGGNGDFLISGHEFLFSSLKALPIDSHDIALISLFVSMPLNTTKFRY